MGTARIRARLEATVKGPSTPRSGFFPTTMVIAEPALRSLLRKHRQTVTEREQSKPDAVILADAQIKRAQSASVFVLRRIVNHAPAPKHVIHQDQTARPQQLEDALVILRIVLFIGVNIGEIETAPTALAQE